MTEVLVTADCWQAEPDAEAVIQRAVAAAEGDLPARGLDLHGLAVEPDQRLLDVFQAVAGDHPGQPLLGLGPDRLVHEVQRRAILQVGHLARAQQLQAAPVGEGVVAVDDHEDGVGGQLDQGAEMLVGLADDNYTELIGGLLEGDRVIVRARSARP